MDTGGGRQAVGRVVTAIDDGRAGFDALLFPACSAGSRGFSRPFWRRAWWFAGLSGATKNASDVICKYYLAVVITRRNYYG